MTAPPPARTPEEHETELGAKLKRLRLHKNLEQAALAAQAGISEKALRSLENGRGSSLRTLILVVRALGRSTWFDTIAPGPTINPLTMVGSAWNARERKRASSARVAKATAEKPTTGEPKKPKRARKGFRIEL